MAAQAEDVGADDGASADEYKGPGHRFGLGNQAWRLRETHGRPRLFATADDLESACVEYFEWAASNPMVVAEPVKYEGRGTLMEVPKPRPLTLRELCTHIGMTSETWREYRKKPDFSAICAHVEDAMSAQKLAGAAAGIFNAAIIAREMGLADKQEHGGAVDHKHGVTDADRAILRELMGLDD